MKTKVAIYGEIPKGLEETYEFIFVQQDSMYSITQEKANDVRDNYSAIIVWLTGEYLNAVGDRLIMLMGGKAKVGVWTTDSHNGGWAQMEGLWSQRFDKLFTAHSMFISQIGKNTFWIPCCLPWIDPVLLPERNETTFDIASVYAPYPASLREEVMVRCIRAIRNKRCFIGFCGHQELGHSTMFDVYLRSRSVLNVNQNIDLNHRIFEALGCGASVLMTPAPDWYNERFDDLRQYVIEFPRVFNNVDFQDNIDRINQINAEPARQIIATKHSIRNRFEEMARLLLQ